MKKIIKWIIGPVGLIVGLLYLTDYDYILKGVRVVYLTGHTTAFIDDLIYFEKRYYSCQYTAATLGKSQKL